jgi:DNA-binding MarR family transcriptional regulator
MRAHAFTMSPLFRLFDMVGKLARRRHRLAEAAFRPLGLTHTEARLLTLLAEEGGSASQESLSRKVTIDRTNVGRSLQGLEQNGLIARSQSESDKRARLVVLSAKGKEAAEEIGLIRNEMAATFFGRLTDEEAERILEILERAMREDEHATEQPDGGRR